MKSFKLLSVFAVCLLVGSLSVYATGFRTEFRDYQINEVDHLNLGKQVDRVWTLTYNASDEPVTVIKHKTAGGTEYVVHSDFFEVCYAVTPRGFGAKKVRNSLSSVPRQINNAVINNKEMKRQEIITPNKLNDEKALGLIANFLPELINENYAHLLN